MSTNKGSSPLSQFNLSSDIKQKLMKALFIILFLAIGYVTAIVVFIVTILQFILDIVLKSPNKNLLDFSKSLSSYSYEVVSYLTYTSDKKPFPFNPWPKKGE